MSQSKEAKKRERSNEMLCQTIAKSICDIIRYSLNDNFRREAFDVLNVESTNDAELKIYRLLMENKCDGVDDPHVPHESETQADASFSGKATVKKRVATHAEESIPWKKTCQNDMSVRERQKLTRSNSFSSVRGCQVNRSDFFPNHSEMWDPMFLS